MNDWGLPDWRDPAGYGDVKRWTLNRWRWEFYRRRDDLRAYFDARAEETYLHWQQYAGKPGFPVAHLRTDEPGFCVIVDVEARKRFGYSGLPNPRIGAQPASAISTWEHDGAGSIIDGNRTGHNGFRGTFGDLLAMARLKLTEEQLIFLRHSTTCLPIHLEQNEMAITFDLKKPLKPQMDHARDMLLWHQANLNGKPLQKRRQPKLWFAYIRALDGKADGATWLDMANTFFEQGLLDRHKDPHGGYCPPPPQAARDKWEAASALRFNF
jgi:hypothetical protein